MKKRLAVFGLVLVAAIAMVIGSAGAGLPHPFNTIAMMYSSDGTGNPGTFTYATGSGGTAVAYVPSPAAMMYSTDGSGNPGTFAYCGSSCFGSGSAPSTSSWVSGPATASSGPGLNTTQLYDFTPTINISTTKIRYNVATADNTADLYDLGFYNSSGTLLCHIGATAGTTFSPSTGWKTITFTGACTLSLTAGQTYYFSQTGNATTAKISFIGGYPTCQGGGSPSSGNTTTGGALNSSVTPAACTWSSVNGFPAIALTN